MSWKRKIMFSEYPQINNGLLCFLTHCCPVFLVTKAYWEKPMKVGLDFGFHAEIGWFWCEQGKTKTLQLGIVAKNWFPCSSSETQNASWSLCKICELLLLWFRHYTDPHKNHLTTTEVSPYLIFTNIKQFNQFHSKMIWPWVWQDIRNISVFFRNLKTKLASGRK